MESTDTLILYSDGINEAADQNEEEFGEDRLQSIVSASLDAAPAELCGRILKRVSAFAGDGALQDDRTLLIVRFPKSRDVVQQSKAEEMAAA